MRLGKNRIVWVVLLGVIGVAAKFAAAQVPSPALLVVVKDENAMAIVDVKTGKVIGRVPVERSTTYRVLRRFGECSAKEGYRQGMASELV